MFSQEKWKRTLAASVGAMCACVVLAAPAYAVPAYPDLRTQSPFDINQGVDDMGSGPHHFLYFAVNLANTGEGAFEIDRSPNPGGGAELAQRIYDSVAGFQDVHVASTPFEASNATVFPAPQIARYELWTQRAYQRAAAWHFRRGTPLYVHDGVEFCLVNYDQVHPDSTNLGLGEGGPPYLRCTPTVIGISAGWLHRQSWFDEFQWIDVGTQALPDGDYVIRAIADPNNLYAESAGKADPARESQVANSGVTYIRIADGLLAGVDPPFTL
jgi:hypothetical protein